MDNCKVGICQLCVNYYQQRLPVMSFSNEIEMSKLGASLLKTWKFISGEDISSQTNEMILTKWKEEPSVVKVIDLRSSY